MKSIGLVSKETSVYFNDLTELEYNVIKSILETKRYKLLKETKLRGYSANLFCLDDLE